VSRLLFNDRFILALSVFIALVLWVQVTGGSAREVQRTFTGIPLGWRDIPEDLSVAEMSPSEVDVTLRGDREIMQDVTRDDFLATVSLAGAEEGSLNYFVTVSVPRGVQLVQVTPQTVTVTLESSVEEVFSVHVSLSGEPEVELAEPSADPTQVVIEGPASRIAEVYQVVAQVDVDGLDRDLREQVICTPVDRHGEPVRGVMVTPRQIDIVVPMEASQVSEDIPIRPVVFGSPPEGLVIRGITANPEKATVTGPESAVEELTHLVTSPVDLSELRLEDLLEEEEVEVGEDEVEAADEADADQEDVGPQVGDSFEYEVTAQVALPGNVDAREIRLEPEEVLLTITLQIVEP